MALATARVFFHESNRLTCRPDVWSNSIAMKTFVVLLALVACVLAKPNLKPHKHHWVKSKL